MLDTGKKGYAPSSDRHNYSRCFDLLEFMLSSGSKFGVQTEPTRQPCVCHTAHNQIQCAAKERNMSVNIIYSQDLNDPGMVERMWQVTPNVIVSARHAPQIGLGGSIICIHTVFI
jgi:hypothetical protein